jgi:Fe2+ or Zn2+ uptake regulation protein
VFNFAGCKMPAASSARKTVANPIPTWMYEYIYKYTHYALLENEERHRRIVTEFISNNQGCTAEQLVDGVGKELSRVPVYKTLKALVAEGLVQDRKANRRDHKFFVDVNNPLVLIPKQLEEIEATFKELLCKSKKTWQDIDEQRFDAIIQSNVVTDYCSYDENQSSL